MAKPFDAATKHLVEVDPAAWLAYVGLTSAGRLDVIDADLSTVTAEADKVVRVEAAGRLALVHFELQATHDRSLGQRLLRYNVLLHTRHGLPVRSIAVLLRPAADGLDLTGQFELAHPDGEPYLRFRYQVIRAWQQPVDAVLTGGLGTLPMAPLADAPAEALADVIRRMDERIRRETTPSEAAVLWTATYLLMGLRFPPGLTRQVLQGVGAMRESSTYQAILDEGRLEEAQLILLRQGQKRFGAPDRETRATIVAMTDLARLEALTERLLDVSSWQELLNGT